MYQSILYTLSITDRYSHSTYHHNHRNFHTNPAYDIHKPRQLPQIGLSGTSVWLLQGKRLHKPHYLTLNSTLTRFYVASKNHDSQP